MARRSSSGNNTTKRKSLSSTTATRKESILEEKFDRALNLDAEDITTPKGKGSSSKKRTSFEAVQIGSTTKKRKISAAATESTANGEAEVKGSVIREEGKKLRVYVMGSNENGELGIGSTGGEDVIKPRLVKGLEGKGIKQIAVGGMHTACLGEEGVWTWGVNDLGALGRDTTWDGGMVNMDGDGGEENSDAEESDDGLNPKESRPGLVDFSGMGVEPGMIKQVVAGDSATWIVTYDGDVYGWGSMRSNEGKELFSPQVRIQKLPTKIPLPEKISKLASGSNHVVALTFSGTIYTWGFAYEQGQLGRKVMERNKKQLFSAFTPRKLALRKIKDIFSGADHSFALAEDGKTVYGWGLNNFGQTGVITNRNAGEDSATVMIPTKFKLGEEEKVEMIAASNKHSLALTKEGKCLGWGQLDGYALGFKLDELPEEWEEVVVRFREKPRILKKPTIIPGLPKLRCIAAGGSHSVAVAEEDGRVWTWGYNISHQLGHRRDEEVETPRVVEGKAVLDKRFVWADAGGQFTVLAEEE